MKRTEATKTGACWPLTNGKVSTTTTGKSIWRAACASLDPELAAAIEQEKDWRHKYPKYCKKIAEMALASPEAAITIAENGIAAALNAFEFIQADGTRVKLTHAKPAEGLVLHTGTVKGGGTASPITVPHQGKALALDDVGQVAETWAEYGCCEPSVPVSIRRLADLGDEPLKALAESHVFVLLGATSELGPFATLMQAGFTVACISRNGKKLTSLLNSMAGHAGTVVVPLSEPAAGLPAGDTAAMSKVAGADLIAQTPELIAWLSDLYTNKTLVLVNLVYLDGEANVRASVAIDHLTQQVTNSRGPGKTALAFYASPATAHPVSTAARDAAQARHKARPFWIRPFNLTPNYNNYPGSSASPTPTPVIDGLLVPQGPNYALAKTLQQWRAFVTRAAGAVVSSNMAPPCRTVSVIRSSQIKAGLEGSSFFRPISVFEPETASAAMALLLFHDLLCPESSANPATALENPSHLHLENSFHGGNWRCAYQNQSIAVLGYLVGAVVTKFGYKHEI